MPAWSWWRTKHTPDQVEGDASNAAPGYNGERIVLLRTRQITGSSTRPRR